VHWNNAQEISCLVAAGMSPADALAAATSRAAECLGIDGSVGTVEKGKRADLVLIDRDPLADVSTLEKGASVRLVMKNGAVAVNHL